MENYYQNDTEDFNALELSLPSIHKQLVIFYLRSLNWLQIQSVIQNLVFFCKIVSMKITRFLHQVCWQLSEHQTAEN